MKSLFIIGLLTLLISNCGYSQKKNRNPFENSKDSLGRLFLGVDFAKEDLQEFLNDSESNLFNGEVLIKNREMLISIAEPILFEIYGKEHILSESPYEIFLFDDYWIMKGTHPIKSKGGTFTIAIHRKTCEVIGISHGK